MKFEIYITFLILIYETSFYLAIEQAIKKSDCTKLYNYLKGYSINYNNDYFTSM